MSRILKFFDWLNNCSYWCVFGLYFAYTMGVSLLIQLVVVPYVLNDPLSVDGLVVPDARGFHEKALELLALMREEGLGSWQLIYQGQAPAGIAALIYYFTIAKPFMLLPLNALVHAASGLLVAHLILRIQGKRFAAYLGGLFFVVNPTSLEWVSQVHRDGVFILGNLLLLAAWVWFYQGIHERRWLPISVALAAGVASGYLFWLTRDYWNSVALVLSVLMLVVLVLGLFVKGDWRILLRPQLYAAVLCVLLVMASFSIHSVTRHYTFPDKERYQRKTSSQLYSKVSADDNSVAISEEQENREKLAGKTEELEDIRLLSEYYSKYLQERGHQAFVSDKLDIDEIRAEYDHLNSEFQKLSESATGLLNKIKQFQETRERKIWKLNELMQTLIEEKTEIVLQRKWMFTSLIPKTIEEKLYGLAYRRETTKYGHGATPIDYDVTFNSLSSMIAYLPRAFQISLFAPFPNTWQGEGSFSYSDLARYLIGVLMLSYYIILIFSAGFILQNRRDPRQWMLTLYAFVGMLLFTYVYANVGTLVRYRYGFYSLLLAMGIAFMASLLQRYLQRRCLLPDDVRKGTPELERHAR